MSTLESHRRLLSEFPAPPADAWRRVAEESLEGGTVEQKLTTKLPEEIVLQPIYSRLEGEAYGLAAGVPGESPFTRGGSGSTERGSRICQELPYGKPSEFNQALLQDLNRGQNAVNLLLDVASRQGFDPDEAGVGEVGGCGLSVCSVADIQTALEGVDLSAVPIYTQAGMAGLQILAMIIARQKGCGLDGRDLAGTIASDPLAEWIQRGVMDCSFDAALNSMAESVSWVRMVAPGLRVIGVQANLWAEAGGTAAHEIGYGMATGVAYLRGLEAKGVPAVESASRMTFTFSLGSHFFVEIAKIRAARMLWTRILEASNVPATSAGFVCHGRSAMWNKSQLDPHVNILRATSEAFVGVAAGCESIHVSAFDECFRVPDDFSRRLARNTQIILQEECHLGRVVDPAGGSWYVETLTRQIAEKAWGIFQTVENQGGMVEALMLGEPQREVARLSEVRRLRVETRKESVIGANLQPNAREVFPSLSLPDYKSLARDRGSQVAGIRAEGDVAQSARVMELLHQLSAAKPGGRAAIMESAFALGASLGEVTKILCRDEARSSTIEPLRFNRRIEAFETLRRRAEAHRKVHGHLPRVFLLNMGTRRQHGARSDFSAGFFAAGGFEVRGSAGLVSPLDAVAAVQADGAPVTVICSTDDAYPDLVPALVAGIKTLRPAPVIVLAGYPVNHVEGFRLAGVDEFIHLRANAAEILTSIYKRIGSLT